MQILCELCGLEDQGTVPCVVCGKVTCVLCSLPAILLDKDGTLLSEIIPDTVAVICSDCNKPSGGARSRRRDPVTPSDIGHLLPC